MEDKIGNIWFATSNKGVFRYSVQEKTITNIAEKESLGENYAVGIAEDKAGNIRFTMKNCICKYDPSAKFRPGSKTFTEYTGKDGLGGKEFGASLLKSQVLFGLQHEEVLLDLILPWLYQIQKRLPCIHCWWIELLCSKYVSR